MKQLLTAYRSTKTVTRLIVLAALTLLASALAFVNQQNILLYAGITILAGLIIEATLKYSRKTIIVLLWVINLFVLSYFVYTVFLITLSSLPYEDAILNSGLVAISGLLSAIISHVLCAALPVGPRWINLIICFFGYYTVTIGLLTLTPTTPIWILSFISIPVVALWPLANAGLRVWLNKRREKSSPPAAYPKNKKVTVLEKTVDEMLKEFTPIPRVEQPHIYFNENMVVMITCLASTEGDIELTGNSIQAGYEDYTWVLEDLIGTAKTFSRENKIPSSKIKPILVFKNTNPHPNKVKTIQVRKRNNPDKMLGTVMLTDVDKLKHVLNSVDVKTFSLREQDRLKNLLPNGFNNIL